MITQHFPVSYYHRKYRGNENAIWNWKLNVCCILPHQASFHYVIVMHILYECIFRREAMKAKNWEYIRKSMSYSTCLLNRITSLLYNNYVHNCYLSLYSYANVIITSLLFSVSGKCITRLIQGTFKMFTYICEESHSECTPENVSDINIYYPLLTK